MADHLTLDTNAAEILAALDRLGAKAEAAVRGAAKVTAVRIQAEAKSRVARATGETAAGIGVRPTDDGTGYMVESVNRRMPNLPLWLEFGTKFQTARPYLFSSARLEEAAHLRRVEEALQATFNADGFGE